MSTKNSSGNERPAAASAHELFQIPKEPILGFYLHPSIILGAYRSLEESTNHTIPSYSPAGYRASSGSDASSGKISTTNESSPASAMNPSTTDVTSVEPVASATKSRPWWKGSMCYQVWPQSFKDSNGDGIGDIKGIISKLDYLKNLGIDCIWVSPVYESPMEDWGYDISNYESIHPQFGSLKDMDDLIEGCHARGMKILMDLVITHTSDQHEWFKESRKSKDNPKADWYMWADKRPDHMVGDQVIEEPSNWRAAFGGSAWTWAPEREQYYIHLFLKEQPDLNWHNAEMREAVYQSAVKFWLDRDIDGFRLDTANRFWKDPNYPDIDPPTTVGKWQPGSKYYINGSKMHEWLKDIRKRMDADSKGKKLVIVGELPLTSYEELLRYVRPHEKELDMVFDFDMVKLGNNDNPDEYAKHQVSNYMDKDPSYTLPKFKAAIAKVQNLITDTDAWGTVFMECHDQPRSISRYATGESKYWREAGKLLCLLQTTLSGTEFIYQGQEIGMQDMPKSWTKEDFKDPDAKIYIQDYVELHHKDDPFAGDNAMKGVFKVGRDNSRTPIQWNNEANAGFTGPNPPWMKVNDNYSWLNVEAQQNDPESIWRFWKDRIAMRKQYAELFMHGTFALYDFGNDRTFTYTKMAEDGQQALVILNFSNDEQPLNTVQRHLLGHEFKLIASNIREPGDKLKPWEGRVYMIREGYVRNDSGTPGIVKDVQDLRSELYSHVTLR